MPVLRDLNTSQEFPLRGKVTLIGRDPLSDIVVGTERTSWRHAIILHSADGHAIEDLDSVNGTYVNGRRIQQRTNLHANDRVDICGLSVVYQPDTGIPRGKQTPTPGAIREGITPLGGPVAASVDMPPQFRLEETGTQPTILHSLDVSGGGRLEVQPEAKLHAVLEISQVLSTAIDLTDVLPKILDTLFRVFPQAERGFFMLRDQATGQLVCKAARHRGSSEKDTLAVSQSILNHVLSNGRAVLSADAGHDDRFDPMQSIRLFRIASVMCVPMISQAGASLGVIQIDTRNKTQPFKEDDLEVLICASTQAARAVELARLHQERRDLEAATRIQKSFLPQASPQVESLQFFDYYAAAQKIGGDYYDYIPLPGNRLAVAVGDVSGKGVAAALLMARLSAATRFCLATEPTAAGAVRRLSNLLAQPENPERFVTFVVFVLDLNDYSMTLVNAGHVLPLRKTRTGKVEELGDSIVGLPLAVYDQPYEELTLTLEPGDMLVLCTDGVTEARNPRGDLYDMPRLIATVRGAPDDAKKVGESILADVTRFAAGRPQSDDLTLVCFGRAPSV
jgi:serine phosphatase RsbU (regulator of sigma subunit)